jgi:hypothetical protein
MGTYQVSTGIETMSGAPQDASQQLFPAWTYGIRTLLVADLEGDWSGPGILYQDTVSGRWRFYGFTYGNEGPPLAYAFRVVNPGASSVDLTIERMAYSAGNPQGALLAWWSGQGGQSVTIPAGGYHEQLLSSGTVPSSERGQLICDATSSGAVTPIFYSYTTSGGGLNSVVQPPSLPNHVVRGTVAGADAYWTATWAAGSFANVEHHLFTLSDKLDGTSPAYGFGRQYTLNIRTQAGGAPFGLWMYFPTSAYLGYVQVGSQLLKLSAARLQSQALALVNPGTNGGILTVVLMPAADNYFPVRFVASAQVPQQVGAQQPLSTTSAIPPPSAPFDWGPFVALSAGGLLAAGAVVAVEQHRAMRRSKVMV